MKHSSIRRFLALLLCAMLVGSMFTTAWADTEETEPAEPQDSEVLSPEEQAEEEPQGMIQPVRAEEPQDGEDEELPIAGDTYLWLGETEVNSTNAGNPLGDNSAKFDPSTNTLTFTKSPTITGLHDGALIDVPVLETLTIVTPASGLSLSSKTAARGISVGSGALTVNGSLIVSLSGSSGDACVYTGLGLSVNGDADLDCYSAEDCYGVKSINGPVTITGFAFILAQKTGIYCGSGDVELTDLVCRTNSNEVGGFSPAAGVYAANGAVKMASLECKSGNSRYVVYAADRITIEGTVEIQKNRRGIYSADGGIVLGGTTNITAPAGCLYAGGSDGISLGGNTTLETSLGAGHTIQAAGGAITAKKNLTVTGFSDPVVCAKNSITVEGNAQITASSSTVGGRGVISEEGSLNVGGNLICTGCSGSGVYAHGDIIIGGDATVGTNIQSEHDYILKAETGELNIGGSLTTTGMAPSSAFGATGITVGKNVTITNAAEDAIGLYSDGKVTMLSGEWDITAKQGILAKEGIQIPETHSIILPEGGVVSQLDGGFTVTEQDGTTIPDHVIISDAEFITITFDFNYAGSTPVQSLIHKGGAVGKLPSVWSHGEAPNIWNLVGWYTEKAEGVEVGQVGDKVTAKTTFDEDTTVYAHWYLPGDINGDGSVDNKDVTRLIRYIKYGDVEAVEYALDPNLDGATDNKDVTRLIRYIKYGDVEIF